MVEKFVVACYGITFRDGKLLMVRQSYGHWAGKWILPGGKLEPGESLEQCVEREILKETGCTVKATNQVVTITSYSPESQFEKQVVLIFYICEYIQGEPATGHHVSAATWVDEERLTRLILNDGVPPQVFNAVSSICMDNSKFPEVCFDLVSPNSICR